MSLESTQELSRRQAETGFNLEDTFASVEEFDSHRRRAGTRWLWRARRASHRGGNARTFSDEGGSPASDHPVSRKVSQNRTAGLGRRGLVIPAVCGESRVVSLRDVPHSSSLPGHAHHVFGRREGPGLRESLCPDGPLLHGGRLSSKGPDSLSGMDVAIRREAAAFEEAKEKLSGAASSTSPNAADSNAISPGIRAAVTCAVQAELKTTSWCRGTRSGRFAARRGRRQKGRPREGQHGRSGLVKAALCSLECIALKHLRHGGLPAGSRALGPTAQSTATRYAALASCISLLSFSGDKRGRQEQVFKDTENLLPRLDAQVRLLCDPALVAYSVVANGGDKSGAPIISALFFLPRASVVPVSGFARFSLNLVKERHPTPTCLEGQGEPVLSPDELAIEETCSYVQVWIRRSA